MSDFITLGIGPGGDIQSFILVGLHPRDIAPPSSLLPPFELDLDDSITEIEFADSVAEVDF